MTPEDTDRVLKKMTETINKIEKTIKSSEEAIQAQQKAIEGINKRFDEYDEKITEFVTTTNGTLATNLKILDDYKDLISFAIGGREQTAKDMIGINNRQTKLFNEITKLSRMYTSLVDSLIKN